MEIDPKNEFEKTWEEWLPRLKDYSNTRIELVKLSLVEATAKAIASFTSNLILFISFLAFFVFASLALALFIGKQLGDYFLGFGIMACFYLLVFLFVLIFRKNQIEKPIMNQTIKKLMENQDDEN